MINKKVIIAGLLASIVMGMIEMMYEGTFGQGFWSPVVYIAATILRSYQSVASPVSFHLLPVIVGLMGHMMNSVILGIIFATLFSTRLASTSSKTVIGMLYGIIVFLMMWFVVVPFIDPVMLKLNPFIFAFSHVMWGGTIGFMVKQRKN